MEVVGIIAIITSIGSLCAIFAKTIKKSSCCFGYCETRTPNNSVVVESHHFSSNQNSPKVTRKENINSVDNYIDEVSV